MRLLALLQVLRRRRRPVTAEVLAAELGVSPRTLYRDIATLAAEGAPIRGAAGLGYVLEAGHFLPPLMFPDEEVDALILGLGLAARRGDAALAAAAESALARVVAVLPVSQGEAAQATGLLAAPAGSGSPHLPLLRQALREERKLHLRYADAQGRETQRVVWPVALGFFELASAQVVENRR